MKNVTSKNTQPAIKCFPIFAGRNKEAFYDYKTKLCVCHFSLQ